MCFQFDIFLADFSKFHSLETCLEFAVSLESLMAGHEQWVYEVHWQPVTYKGMYIQIAKNARHDKGKNEVENRNKIKQHIFSPM